MCRSLFPRYIVPIIIFLLHVIGQNGNASDTDFTVDMIAQPSAVSPMRSGPIPIDLVITNPSQRALSFIWNEHNIPVTFHISGTADPSSKNPIGNNYHIVNVLVSSISIKAHSKFRSTIYLTKNWIFGRAGNIVINWECALSELPAEDNAMVIHSNFKGNVELSLRDDNTVDIKDILDHQESLIRISDNNAVKNSAIQEICSINNPEVVPYLARLINITDSEHDVVKSLLYFQENSLAQSSLHQMIALSKNGSTITYYLNYCLAHSQMVSDEELKLLLSSPNAEIRYNTLLYLGSVINHFQLGRIHDLTNDPTADISNLAKKILKSFEDAVSTSPKVPEVEIKPAPEKNGNANKF